MVRFRFKNELTRSMSLLAIKDTELEQERQRADEAHMKLRSEAKRHKEQIKRTLEFNQATKVVEPLEYIYICTTEYYQRNHKFKVGGVQTFELLKSRLTQYNSGESTAKPISLSTLEKPSVTGLLNILLKVYCLGLEKIKIMNFT